MKFEHDEIKKFIDYYKGQSYHNMVEICKELGRVREDKYPPTKNRKYDGYNKGIPYEVFKKLIRNTPNERAQLGFLIMYYCGLRISEVVRIQKQDISNDWILTVKNIKCKREDKLVIPKVLRRKIEDFLVRHKGDIKMNDNYLLYSMNPLKKKPHLSENWLRNYFRERTLELGINKVYSITRGEKKRKLYLYSTHSCRHGFGMRFYKASDKDIEMTRMALRHRDLKSTQVYVNHELEDVFKIMEGI